MQGDEINPEIMRMSGKLPKRLYPNLDPDGLLVASVNRAWLLKRGWTRSMIRRFLGEPDRRIPRRENHSRPECRYEMQRVREAEARPDFWWAPLRLGRRVGRPRKLQREIPAEAVAPMGKLSKRDRRIVSLLYQGKRQREIAARLRVSQQTVSLVWVRFQGNF